MKGEGRRVIDPVQFFKCLAEETRLRCLLLIDRHGELCVCELTQALDVVQPKISRHLAQLRQCQLLLDRKQGQWVYYRLNPQLPEWVLSVLKQSSTANTGYIEGNLARLAVMGAISGRQNQCCA